MESVPHFSRPARALSGSALPAAARIAYRSLLLPLLLLFSASLGFGQASAGLTGTLTDSSGAVVPNVTITIHDQATGVEQRTVTSSAGVYSINDIIAGRYTLTAEAPGFKKEVRSNIPIEIGVTSNISIQLATGESSETVQVNASSITLNTTSPELGTTIEPELLNALPTEVAGRGRQIDSFQFLAPGVQGNSFTHEVSGGVWFQQEVVVNGIPLPQAETQGMTTLVNPPWELVREFRVERSTFSAQYGLGQGAVNYQTASGGNKYHFDLFEINRNSSFDSKGFFNSTGRVPTDHENNYGFSVEGPASIPKLYNGHDRTFFHFSAEWFKRNAQDTALSTVPTTQERAGDFSDFVDPGTGQLIPIYDPQTGQQFNYGGRLNVIDPARISARSKSLLQYLPDPDRAGTGIGGLDSNKNYVSFPNPVINHNWGFTIDHKLTDKQSLHYAEWRNTLGQYQIFTTTFVVPPNPLSSFLYEPQTGTGFLLNYANNLTPHLVATAGIGWLGEINNENPVVNSDFAAVQNPLVFPQISFDGVHAPTQWGTSGSLAHSVNRKLGLAGVNNWLWQKGRHTLNIGGEARRTYQDAYQDGGGGGHFSFSHDTTSTPNQGAGFNNNGSSFASFLLGEVDSANRSFSEYVKLRNFDLSPYLMDDVKINPRLTANIGLRWDIMRPFTANDNNVAFLAPNTPNTYAGGLPGTAVQLGTCATCAGYNRADVHWGHVGPRVGMAYMLSNKMVIQAGFSLAYLIGGAYDYGDNLVADEYTSLLAGTFSRNSNSSNTPAYGSWDTQQLPAPPASPITGASGAGSTIYQFDRNSSGFAPYTQQWNLNLQRQLPFDTFLTLAYIGNREIHILSHLNPLNQPDPSILQLGNKLNDSFADGTAQADGFKLPYGNFVNDFGSSATVRQSLSPYPQYGNIVNNFEGDGTVFYNALQAEAEKRYTNGLAFLTSVTIGRTLSNNDGGNSAFAAQAVNKYDQSKEYTIASSDQKYNVKVSTTYELPIGIHKQFFNHGLAARILGNIQISGILDYEGGTPFGVTENGNPLGQSYANRPDRVAGVPLSTASYKGVKNYFLGTAPAPVIFNPGAFAQTATYALGNAVRNYAELRNPPFRNENLNASKHFVIGERYRFTIQADFFNAFNRTIFAGPNTNTSYGNFGTVTSAGQSNGTRQGQFTGKLEF